MDYFLSVLIEELGVCIEVFFHRNRRYRDLRAVGVVVKYLNMTIQRGYFLPNTLLQTTPCGYGYENHHHPKGYSTNSYFDNWRRNTTFAPRIMHHTTGYKKLYIQNIKNANLE